VIRLPLIIAHRGASAQAPENTLAAFRRALLDGAEGIECDVRLAGDNVPVVFHDATLRRTALREGKLSDFTSRELGDVGVGAWFNFKFPKKARADYESVTVPTLAEVFELMRANDKLIYVEMKCENGGHRLLADAVAALIRDFRYQTRVIVKSFEQEAAREIKKLLPEVRVAALFSPRPLRVLHPRKSLINPALHLDADELSLHFSLATERAVQKATDANLKTVIWTANHPRWVKRALRLGIYGLITNNPARLLARREKVLAELDKF
jgi:glycerophosphoryl diester phosphodiesterase